MTSEILAQFMCRCPDIYSIEPHGEGWALYLGRCNHRHGYNLANIQEPDLTRLNELVSRLNSDGHQINLLRAERDQLDMQNRALLARNNALQSELASRKQ